MMIIIMTMMLIVMTITIIIMTMTIIMMMIILMTTMISTFNFCRLRGDASSPKENLGEKQFSEFAFDLLRKCLEPNPFQRVTAEEALNHPYLSKI